MSRAAFSTSSLSKFLFLILPLILAGCGFQPLYGKPAAKTTPGAVLAGVKIDHIPSRLGQEFRIKLEDELNPGGMPAKPMYRLSATINYSEAGIGVARDGTVSRYNIYLDSKYQLIRISDGQLMTQGSLRQVSSYNNITNEYFSTYVSQEDALRRGMAELALMYRQRLASYLSENGGRPEIQKEAPPPLNPLTPETPAGQNTLIPRSTHGL